MPDKGKTDANVDKAVEDSFPASDPMSSGRSTANEEPARPVDRQAPIVRKEDVEAARRGDAKMG